MRLPPKGLWGVLLYREFGTDGEAGPLALPCTPGTVSPLEPLRNSKWKSQTGRVRAGSSAAEPSPSAGAGLVGPRCRGVLWAAEDRERKWLVWHQADGF